MKTKLVSTSRRSHDHNLLCFRLRGSLFNDEELAHHIEELYQDCFSKISLGKNMKLRRDGNLRKLNRIVRGTRRVQLQAEEPRRYIFCSVKILLYFQEYLNSREGPCDWKRRRQYRSAKDCYDNLVKSFVPEKSAEVVRALTDIMQVERLWQLEDLCHELLCTLLDFGVSGAMITHHMWNKVEDAATEVNDAREIIHVLYELLNVYDWPEDENTVLAVERLLKLYRGSVLSSGVAPYAPLRKGLEVCIRHVLQHISNEHLLRAVYRMCSWSVGENTTDDSILDFGSILEYAAFMYRAGSYSTTLTPELFPVLMRMIASPNRLVSLVGNRVLQYLIDRKNNRGQFDTPKIFFENTVYDLKLSSYNREDKQFVKDHREELHDSLVKSIMNHCATRLNLETTYCTVCLMAVEVPCGFTAAILVCLAMNIQDLTLEQNDLQREVAYHLHATVMAVMSLLCWIHRAKVFHAYVNKIMMERAQWAPHLNPPLQSHYSFAIHHVLWDKPELFFVDWEARYGLWKCFRLRDGRRSTGELSDS